MDSVTPEPVYVTNGVWAGQRLPCEWIKEKSFLDPRTVFSITDAKVLPAAF